MLVTMDNKRTYRYNIDGKIVPDHENMLAKLLDDGILFCNSRKYVEWMVDIVREETIVLFVNCNDTFFPAADAESLTLTELPILFSLYESKSYWGVTEFVAKKRKVQPMSSVKQHMIETGVWTEELEKLAKNRI
jgi:hypothetical protein